MTCKDCIHYDVCSKKEWYLEFGKISDCDGIDKLCKTFKDKSHFFEFPCIAYVINEIKYKTDMNTFITFRKIDTKIVNSINDIARIIIVYDNIFFQKKKQKKC